GWGYAGAELPGGRGVARVRRDMAARAKLPGMGVGCCAGAGSRWKARYFAPGPGVQGDPATGSAAGALAVHLARRGRIAWGQEIEINQGAEIGRPSRLYARATGSAGRIDFVEVAGAAVMGRPGGVSAWLRGHGPAGVPEAAADNGVAAGPAGAFPAPA